MANTETDPLAGPHMSALQITGSTDPGHAGRLLRALGHEKPSRAQLALEDKMEQARAGLLRAGLTGAEARVRAPGVYNDWLSAVTGRHTAEPLETYAERIGRGEF